MTSIKDHNEYGAAIESSLLLRTFPLAIKMLETENAMKSHVTGALSIYQPPLTRKNSNPRWRPRPLP